MKDQIKKQKKLVQVLVLIIFIGVIIVFSIIGIGGYKNYQIERLEKEVGELKNKKPQIIIKEVPSDLPFIIKEWSPKVAYMECSWRSRNILKGGSGLFNNNLVVTNKHVFEEQGIIADFCMVQLPNDDAVYVPWTNFMISKDKTVDLAMIKITQPTKYMQNLEVDNPLCEQKAAVGDKVVILGYPDIGSSESITATEGIISGYEGYYYVTSAKIEYGNSGGVAISVKDNCNLGVPTNVVVGELESLGRIIDIKEAIPLTY